MFYPDHLVYILQKQGLSTQLLVNNLINIIFMAGVKGIELELSYIYLLEVFSLPKQERVQVG